MRESAEIYGETFAKRYQEDLWLWTDHTGKLQENFLSLAKELDNKLSQFPWYIGIAPHGSRLRGTAKAFSDYDLAVIFDPLLGDSSSTECLATINQEVTSLRLRHSGPGGIHVSSQDLNPEEYLKTHRNATDVNMVVSFLFSSAFGPRVPAYQKEFGSSIATWSKDEQKLFIEKIVTGILDLEKSRKHRIPERISGMEKVPIEELDAMIEKRRPKWRAHVEYLLGVSE